MDRQTSRKDAKAQRKDFKNLTANGSGFLLTANEREWTQITGFFPRMTQIGTDNQAQLLTTDAH
jgi:hypothetical protein